MATFVPQLDSSGASEPQFIGYSKGQESDKSKGTILGAVGDFIKEGTTAVDDFFKNTIKEQAASGVDEILGKRNDAFTQSVFGGPPPKDIQGNLEKLKKVQQAKDAGITTDAYYQLQLDTLSRDLRYKYSGYREYIDKEIHKLTGTTPANKLNSDLQAMLNAKSDNSEEKQYDQYKKLAIENGLNVPALEAVRRKNGDLTPLPVEVFQSHIAEKKGQEASVSLANSQATLNKNDIELNRTRGKQFAIRQLSQNETSDLNTALAAAGIDINKKVAEYAANPQALDEKAKAELTNQINAYELQADTNVMEFLTKRDPVTGLTVAEAHGMTRDDIQEVREYKKAQRTIFMEPLATGKFAVFGDQVRRMNWAKESAESKLMADGATAAYEASNKLHGPQMTQMIYQNDQTFITNTKNKLDALAYERTRGELYNGASNSIAQAHGNLINFNKTSQGQKVNAAAVAEGMVNATAADVVNPKLDPSLRSRAIQVLYNPSNVQWLDKVQIKNSDGSINASASQAKRLELYKTMTTPEIAQRVELEAKRNPSVGESYASFAVNAGVVLSKQTIDDVKSQFVDRDSFAQITWDPKSMTFQAAPRTPSSAAVEQSDKFIAPAVLANAQRKAAELNSIVRGMAPAVKISGHSNPSGFIEQGFNQLGLDINAIRYGGDGKIQGRLSGRSNLQEGDITALQQALGSDVKGTMADSEILQMLQDRYSVNNKGSKANQALIPEWNKVGNKLQDSYSGIRNQILETQKVYDSNPTPELHDELGGLYDQLNTLFKQTPRPAKKPTK